MNPELPPDDRGALEARVTALLLGELNAEEAAAMRLIIAQDAALAKMHERLRLTLDLVRETAANPAGELSEPPAPLKLSPARREALLAHFKTVTPKEFAQPQARSISRLLVELAAVVAILFVLAGMLLPKLASSKTKAEHKTITTLNIMAAKEAKSYVESRDNREDLGEPAQLQTRERVLAEMTPPPATPPITPIYTGQAEESTDAKLSDQGLTLNLKGVTVDKALDYLGESEGLTINRTTRTIGGDLGTLDLRSDTPLNKDETVALLNKSLANKGLTAFQDKDTLTIMTTDDAMYRENIPINIITNAADIPQVSQMVTEVIPVHSLNPAQVIKDHFAQLPPGDKMDTSESGNAIIVTAPEADIRGMAQKIKALDSTGNSKLASDSTDVGNPFASLFGRRGGGGGAASTTFINGGSLNGRNKEDGLLEPSQNALAVEAPPSAAVSSPRAMAGEDIPVHSLNPVTSPYAAQGQVAPVTMTFEPINNNVIYITSPGNQSNVAVAITSLARPESGRTNDVNGFYDDNYLTSPMIATNPPGHMETYVYHPETADVSDLQGPLMDLFPAPSGKSSSTSSQQNALMSRRTFAATSSSTTASSALKSGSVDIVVNSGDISGGIGGGGFGIGGIAGGRFAPAQPNDPNAAVDPVVLARRMARRGGESEDKYAGTNGLVGLSLNDGSGAVNGNGTLNKTEARLGNFDLETDKISQNQVDRLGTVESAKKAASDAGPSTPATPSGIYLGADVDGSNPGQIAPAASDGNHTAGLINHYDSPSQFIPQSQLVAGSSIGVPAIGSLPASGLTNRVIELDEIHSLVEDKFSAAFTRTNRAGTMLAVEDEGSNALAAAAPVVNHAPVALAAPAVAPPAAVPLTKPSIQFPDVARAKPSVPPPVPQPEIQTSDNAFSTFSLNVSDVSFKLAAASLQNGSLPDAATVRSEEFINAFDYRDSEPAPGAPVGFTWERAGWPFAHNRDLLRFSVKTATQGRQAGRPLNLVLLLDKSGSMERADRVAIIREALRVLAGQLQPQDTLSVVVFARTARLWADGVSGSQAGALADALEAVTPEGGTNLEEAMKLAYETALRHYLAHGENRVVVLTDGAANLGNVEPDALKKKVEANRAQGISLDCFGVGWEDYNDNLLEVLSRTGGGRYGFINTPEEAASGFAGQLAGALRVAASDVKVQVEFNPNRVTSWRQMGYAKDQLKKEQFRDNSVKAAQLSVAESGNALYTVEINPAGDGPIATVRMRYRTPGTADYYEHEWDVPYTGVAAALDQSSPAMRLAGTAAAFSEWLAGSPYAGGVTLDQLQGCLRGVPEFYGADTRPKLLETMLREAKSISGK